MSLTQSTALLVTLAVEVPLVLLLTRRWHYPWGRCLVAAVLASCISHPIAWKLSWVASVLLQSAHYGWWFVAIEFGVCFVEALLYWLVLRLCWQRTLFLSVIANATSALFGILLWS